MTRFRILCAILLALPLIGSGGNFIFGFIDPPSGTGFRGEQILDAMRAGGLVQCLAIGHLVLGALLLLPRWRFAAGLLQLPLTCGIFAFNLTLFPPGVALASSMLVLNLFVVSDASRLRQLVLGPESDASSASRGSSAFLSR
ncbi:MAG: hypothetical protein ACI835_005329 [Planctomycetota bacterium]|jgi:hypothetical protein